MHWYLLCILFICPLFLTSPPCLSHFSSGKEFTFLYAGRNWSLREILFWCLTTISAYVVGMKWQVRTVSSRGYWLSHWNTEQQPPPAPLPKKKKRKNFCNESLLMPLFSHLFIFWNLLVTSLETWLNSCIENTVRRNEYY